ncbi:hypothetical protein Tco_0664470 [Tanacetum coccineum]
MKPNRQQKSKVLCDIEIVATYDGMVRDVSGTAARTYRNSNGPPSRLPSLVLADKSYNQESRELFLLSNKSIRKIRLPEAYGKQCRSSCGWLLTFGKDFASQLINPLSREIINLPNLNTFPEPIHPRNWDIAIKKVVLLMESKLVFVIGGSNNKLGFCHIGDNKWTFVEPHKGISDITFYNGRVYCFDRNNNILACNVNGKDPEVLVDVATMPRSYFHQDVSKAYIVGLDDDKRKQLLVIFKEAILHHWECPRTKSFKAVAYDLESGNFSEVKDFGRKTLFLGLSSSFWTEDTTGVIKGDCIYYTDDVLLRYSDSEYIDMGIYHLSDGTIEPHFAGESRLHVTGESGDTRRITYELIEAVFPTVWNFATVRRLDSGQDESASSAQANDEALSSDDPVVSSLPSNVAHKSCMLTLSLGLE